MPKTKETARLSDNSRARSDVTDVRITDVAALAQVSPMTVSRAMNNPEVVAAETLRRIQNAIQQLGYVPNRLAGSLSSSKSRLIAAIVPTVAHSLFSAAIEAFSSVMSDAGYQVLLGISGYDDNNHLQVLEAALSRRPEAILLIGVVRSSELRARLLNLKLPILETWDLTDLPIDMLVGFSHHEVGAAVARHFMERGYRKPAIISANDPRALARHDGFVRALAGSGIVDVVDIAVRPPSSVELGKKMFNQILDDGAEIDCIFCGSDLLALGVLGEARRRGLSIPGDLAVCGFGDLDFAAEMRPALTSVSVDGSRIGTLSASSLLARLGGKPFSESMDVGFKIIERETT